MNFLKVLMLIIFTASCQESFSSIKRAEWLNGTDKSDSNAPDHWTINHAAATVTHVHVFLCLSQFFFNLYFLGIEILI